MRSLPPFKQQKYSVSCCQGSCHYGKEKKKVLKLVLSLIQELSIFLEAPREQMLSWSWQDIECWKETISRLIDGGQSVTHSLGDIKDRQLAAWNEKKMHHAWTDKNMWKTFQNVQSKMHVCVYVWSLGFPSFYTNLLQRKILNYISSSQPHCGNPQRYASLDYCIFICSHAMQLMMRNTFLKVWNAYRKATTSNIKIISLSLGQQFLRFLKGKNFRGCALTHLCIRQWFILVMRSGQWICPCSYLLFLRHWGVGLLVMI